MKVYGINFIEFVFARAGIMTCVLREHLFSHVRELISYVSFFFFFLFITYLLGNSFENNMRLDDVLRTVIRCFMSHDSKIFVGPMKK